MIKIEQTVERRKWTTYDAINTKGSGYCKDSGEYQALIKRWKWSGYTIWKRTVDWEEIPSCVWIEQACFGFYSGSWRSKLIDRQY